MKGAVLAVIALVLGGLLVLTAVVMTSPGPEAADYKYVVTNVGGTYYAKNDTGVVLTSGSDAATVINAAINALTLDRTVKEKVLLRGDLTISSEILVSSYTTLEVAQGGRVTGADHVDTFLVRANGMDNIDIIGGEWDGNGANRDQAGNTIMAFTSCSNVNLSGIYAHDAAYDAIAFDSCGWVTVFGAEIGRVAHTALVMGNCSNCTLENSHIYDCGGGGCYFLCEEGVPVCICMNNTLRNNTVERTYLTGLSIASLREPQHRGGNSIAEHNTVIDCGLDGTHPGIACGWGDNKATNCTIRYNTVYETKDFWPPNGNGTNGGIGAGCRDSQIYGNVVRDTYDFGIEVSGDSNVVRDNRISGSKTSFYGGLVCEDLNNGKLMNNTIENCPAGIRLVGSCNENQMAGNTFMVINYSIVIEGPNSTGNIIGSNVYIGQENISDGGTGTVIGNGTASLTAKMALDLTDPDRTTEKRER